MPVKLRGPGMGDMTVDKVATALARVEAARAAGDGASLGAAFDSAMPSGRPVPGLEAAAVACLSDARATVRNAAAVALVDMRATAAGPALAAAACVPGVSAQCGTLVYALVELGCRIAPGQALHLARHGSHEARVELVELCREGRVTPFGPEGGEDLLEDLEELAHGDDDAAYAASEVLGALRRAGCVRGPASVV